MTIIETDNFTIAPPPRFDLESSAKDSNMASKESFFPSKPLSGPEISHRHKISHIGKRVIELHQPSIDFSNFPTNNQAKPKVDSNINSYLKAKEARENLRKELSFSPSMYGEHSLSSIDQSMESKDITKSGIKHDSGIKPEANKRNRLRKIAVIGAAVFSIVAGSSIFGNRKVTTDTMKASVPVAKIAMAPDNMAPMASIDPKENQQTTAGLASQDLELQLDASADTPWQAAAEVVGANRAAKFLTDIVQANDSNLVLHGVVGSKQWISIGESGPSDSGSVINHINTQISSLDINSSNH